ncbi:MAG: aldo/keto reductase [Rhizobiales bacterium]|nr:aldo/keto reductase [Hyphomicrobiales bacterium]
MPLIHANGAAIPALGFGTAGIAYGGPGMEGDAGVRLVAQALRDGHRHIDAARKYGTEKEVGQGMRASGVPRDEMFLISKVSHENLRTADFEKSVEESLRDHDDDYLDLLLVHWPNPAIPLEETMQALAKQKRTGIARHIGIANFKTALIEDAVRLCPEPLVANEVEFHPYIDQSKVHAATRKHGMALIGYCPFMRGGDILNDPVIGEIAKAHGRAPAQVILRWITQNDGLAPIPKSTKPERHREFLAIFEFELTKDEFDRIAALRSKNQRRANPPHAPVWDKP